MSFVSHPQFSHQVHSIRLNSRRAHRKNICYVWYEPVRSLIVNSSASKSRAVRISCPCDLRPKRSARMPQSLWLYYGMPRCLLLYMCIA